MAAENAQTLVNTLTSDAVFLLFSLVIIQFGLLDQALSGSSSFSVAAIVIIWAISGAGIIIINIIIILRLVFR